MHEHALIRDVIDVVLGELRKNGVRSGGLVAEVSLKVGSLEIHSEEAFRQVYEVLSRDTILAGSALKIETVPPKLSCVCGFDGCASGSFDPHDPLPAADCPSCGKSCRLTGGKGVGAISLALRDG